MKENDKIGRRKFLNKLSAATAGSVALTYLNPMLRNENVIFNKSEEHPNILFFNADDWGWPFCSAYGDKVVRTPAFDKVAREGVLFKNAYCACSSSTPSRSSALSGRMFYQLETGSMFSGTLPRKFAIYPDILEAAGYIVGSAMKGWGPGSFKDGGWPHQPAGKVFSDFSTFLKDVPPEKPFCFWLGPTSPHRRFPPGSGVASGLQPEEVKVPPMLPDVPDVRNDILDYYNGIERADKVLNNALKAIEEAGRYENTIVVATGDNGFPFPRGKANCYDLGIHVPMAIRWPNKIKEGRVVDDFISQSELAPTFLEAVGIKPPASMTCHSFLDILISPKSGRVDLERDFIVAGLEWHGVIAPMRCIRNHNFSYIRNFKPGPYYVSDDGPTKRYISKNADDPIVKPFYELCFGNRPSEELYDLSIDPYELKNVAGDQSYVDVKKKMATNLGEYLFETQDPRIIGGEEMFDEYYKQALIVWKIKGWD